MDLTYMKTYIFWLCKFQLIFTVSGVDVQGTIQFQMSWDELDEDMRHEIFVDNRKIRLPEERNQQLWEARETDATGYGETGGLLKANQAIDGDIGDKYFQDLLIRENITEQ
ncbi:hypothetical protein EGW08_000178, partial [Elysia chlorotica]